MKKMEHFIMVNIQIFMIYKNVISHIIFVLFCICQEKCDMTVRKRTIPLKRAPGLSMLVPCTVVHRTGA
jgi:hypothetical protein